MSRRPRVSVVSIFRDGEPYLGEAAASVLAQTYGDWELLLVDDGSRDGSAALAQALAHDDDRVRCLHHPGRANRGMSASRNLGLTEAAGELVAFLDADDVFLPDKLERQVRLLDAHPEAALTYGATLHWHSWAGASAAADRPRKLGVAPETLQRPPVLVTRFLLGAAWPPATCGVLVRRAAALAVGGFEPSFRGMFEDQVFFYKLLLRFPAYVHEGTLDRYRQHQGSASQVALRSGRWSGRPPNEAHGRFLLWLRDYLAASGIRDPRVWSALRYSLLAYERPRLYRVLDGAVRTARRRGVRS